MNKELFKQKIRECGLTQVELAKKAGVSRGTVQNIMSGKTKPCSDVSTLISDALELTEKDFLAIFYKNNRFRKDDEAPHSYIA